MRPIAHPTPVFPSVRVSRKLATLATIAAAAGAGAVTIAVVDDGDSGTGSQSLSRPAPDVRYDGGPNEGTAALATRSQSPVRPTEGAAVQSMRLEPVSPVARPDEGAAVRSMRAQPVPQPTRPEEGTAVLSMSHSSSPVTSQRPEEGAASRAMGR